MKGPAFMLSPRRPTLVFHLTTAVSLNLTLHLPLLQAGTSESFREAAGATNSDVNANESSSRCVTLLEEQSKKLNKSWSSRVGLGVENT